MKDTMWVLDINNGLILQFGSSSSDNTYLPISYTSYYSCCCTFTQGTAGWTIHLVNKFLTNFLTHSNDNNNYSYYISFNWLTSGY